MSGETYRCAAGGFDVPIEIGCPLCGHCSGARSACMGPIHRTADAPLFDALAAVCPPRSEQCSDS